MKTQQVNVWRCVSCGEKQVRPDQPIIYDYCLRCHGRYFMPNYEHSWPVKALGSLMGVIACGIVLVGLVVIQVAVSLYRLITVKVR